MTLIREEKVKNAWTCEPHRTLILAAVLAALLASGGCSVFPVGGFDNDGAPQTRRVGQYSAEEVRSASDLASLKVSWDVDWKCRDAYRIVLGAVKSHPSSNCPRTDDRFVGIALSGGGSRAAVFSAAVLFELQKYGILQQADVISSVSGGSYTAALYALSCDTRENCPVTVEGPGRTLWAEDEVYPKLQKEFVWRWFGNWFWPYNIVKYWLTDYNRSQIMADTLDANLYDNSTLGHEGFRFHDLNPQRPQLIINATDFTDHLQAPDGSSPFLAGFPGSCRRARFFTFTRETFAELGSDLDQYRIADAVVASSAFPAVFNYVNLKNFAKDKYVHLLDAGPFDNLGLTSLQCALDDANQAAKKPGRKFFLLVDASVSPRGKAADRAATRSGIDHFVDLNVLDAVDILFEGQHRNTIEDAGDAATLVSIDFRGLREDPDAAELYGIVNAIATNLSIQDYQADCLKRAAVILVGQAAKNTGLKQLIPRGNGYVPDASKTPQCVKPPKRDGGSTPTM